MSNQKLLVVSLSGALIALQERKITIDDLENALFFVSHTYQEAMEYIRVYEGNVAYETKKALLHILVSKEISKYTAWNVSASQEHFNLETLEWLGTFLKYHKIPYADDFIKHVGPDKSRFFYPVIDRAIKAAKIPLTVIYP